MAESTQAKAAASQQPTYYGAAKQVAAREGQLTQLIVFHLGDEDFGIEISQVREIIRSGAITPIPDSPAFIRGVINVRGDIVATINLKSRFSLQGDLAVEPKHIVITSQEPNVFGLLVDEVTEVLRIPTTDIKPPPEIITRMHEEYVTGVVTREDRLIILLDVGKVLSDEELVRMTQLQREQRTKPAPQHPGETGGRNRPAPAAAAGANAEGAPQAPKTPGAGPQAERPGQAEPGGRAEGPETKKQGKRGKG